MTDWNKKLDEVLWIEPEHGNMKKMLEWSKCLYNLIDCKAQVIKNRLSDKISKTENLDVWGN